jgi:AhpD family alkylhydroperoxidase
MPYLIRGFDLLRRETLQDGHLSRKVKELMAMGLAIGSRCETSTAYHLHNALEAGATYEQVVEAVGVVLSSVGEAARLNGIRLLEGLAREQGKQTAPDGAPRPYMVPD